MPCDGVAVVRARLDVDAAADILSAPEAVDALIRWLRREFGACVVGAAADKLRLAVGAPYPAFEARLSRRDGLVTTGFDWAGVAPAPPRVEAFARDLAAAAAQERLVRALRRRDAVESDEADPGGYRRLTARRYAGPSPTCTSRPTTCWQMGTKWSGGSRCGAPTVASSWASPPRTSRPR